MKSWCDGINDGELCGCGNHSCLETLASTRAVVQRAMTLLDKFHTSLLARDPVNITLDSVQSAFETGDPLARRVVLDAGHCLGLSIGSLISMLNMQRFVLIGDMTRFGETWLETVRSAPSSAAAEWLFPSFRSTDPGLVPQSETMFITAFRSEHAANPSPSGSGRGSLACA
ncbi:MAG TPA: ROK family protein [Anaerolineales bacterium]